MAKNCYDLPDTSVTLLNDIGRSHESRRWAEFLKRYEPGMRAFLRHKWPFAPADDIVQSAHIRLVKALPNYHYTRGQKERFHNYLISIVHREALKWYDKHVKHHPDVEVRDENDSATNTPKKKRRRVYKPLLKEGMEPISYDAAPYEFEDAEILQMKKDLAHEATEQVLKDDSISEVNREIFRLLVREHRLPAEVAEDFGKSRGNVDKIKHDIIVLTRKRFKGMLKAAGLDE